MHIANSESVLIRALTLHHSIKKSKAIVFVVLDMRMNLISLQHLTEIVLEEITFQHTFTVPSSRMKNG